MLSKEFVLQSVFLDLLSSDRILCSRVFLFGTVLSVILIWKYYLQLIKVFPSSGGKVFK